MSQEVSSAVQRIIAQDDLCRDCQACALACSLSHEGECHLGLARLRISKDMPRYTFAITYCRHCAEPACLAACPSGALARDARGVVILEDALCTRCGECATACLYETLFYAAARDRYLKCDLCAGRAEGPLCVAVCPVGALVLGEGV